ncbi:putative ceramide synthase 6 isoform X2 [Penaeus vannamei]|uniref:Putative ceramide synthase 6 isoform X2 n=1 Tax=Penaeus vannamei TaxID=6689 RepID=A0A423SN26_PENVA|nr:ceramide synthase 2-like isoform X2 [Penaeus vannamei]ROT65645.1 putative ceramide synthase 6 isoform X2 [Penaeus vannamei]
MREADGSMEFLFIPQIQQYLQDNVASDWWRRCSATFWSQEFWLPAGLTWDDIHTSLYDILFIPLLVGLFFVLLRHCVVEPFLLLPIARKAQIPNKRPRPPEPNKTLQVVFQRYETSPPKKVLAEASRATRLTERQVERWLRRSFAMNRLNRHDKFLDCGFKLVCHVWFGIMGAAVTLSKPWFWDTTLCWKGYPDHPVTTDVYWYYMILLGYYWAITYSELPRPGGKGSDKAQMILHHSLTILLIVFSWTTGYVRIGSLILFVHEYSDIALLAAKVCHYSGNDAPTEPLFVAFLVLWGITRCGILPFWIVRSVFTEATPAGVQMPALYMMQSWFVGLLCLTAIWTGLIVRTVSKKLRGEGLKDARSATEDSESDKAEKKD